MLFKINKTNTYVCSGLKKGGSQEKLPKNYQTVTVKQITNSLRQHR